jgi:hypothetical protein
MEPNESSVAPPNEWNVKASRFVGFFDVLGFKELMLRESHDEVSKKLQSIHEISDAMHDKDGSDEVMLRCVKFSDSIVLITNDDSKEAGEIIIRASAWILAGALAKLIPMKGSMAYGTFTADFDNSLYLGQPLIDAYLLQNELKMYGCILHHTAEKKLKELDAIRNSILCIAYNTPMSSGSVKHMNINWLDPLKYFNIDIPHLQESLYLSVSGIPRKYVDNTCSFSEFVNKVIPTTPRLPAPR